MVTKGAMRVQVIARPTAGQTGMSRYTTCLVRGLRTVGTDVCLTQPAGPPFPLPLARALRRTGLDVEAFFGSYPLRARLEPAGVYHLAGQTLATLLLFQRFPGPTVVTVLDIIPWLVRHDPALNTFGHGVDRFFYRLALAGLKRADAIVAISEYTKRTLVQALGLPQGRIHVVYPGVDHERFRPVDVPASFRARYGLDRAGRYVLFVGSDDPRKNLPTLVRAFARVKQRIPEVRLLKVGAPHFQREREHLLALIEELELTRNVLFFDGVSDEDLPLFYNAAGLLVLPSLYEGFGLPVVEAMACGTPVVCSDATALPEVAGHSALLVEPSDDRQLAEALCRVLVNQDLQQRLRRSSLERSESFALQRQAADVTTIYSEVSRRTP